MDEPIPFRRRLRLAAEAGLMLGVKLTLALVVPAIIAFLLAGDYLKVRADASYSADVIRTSIAQQQKAQGQPQATPQAPPPAPGVK